MTSSGSVNARIEAHYSRAGLGELILAALRQAGKDLARLTVEDLAPFDEFHVRGREATLELGRLAGLTAGSRVLDVGSGLGGPSRCIARTFGCHVTGIDLTEEYCGVATMLAKLTAMTDAVQYRQADAMDLPFPAESFDVVWTQHTSMNIADKAGFFRELGRTLKRGGTLAVYDILAGPVTPIHFPVPWARVPGSSFLCTAGELRSILEGNGYRIEAWQDSTDQARLWFTAVARRIQERGPAPLGLHLLMGDDFATMANNQRRNLEEGRIATVQVVARKI